MKKSLLLISIIIVSLNSCKKNSSGSNNSSNPTISYKVKSFTLSSTDTTGNSFTTYNLTYDNKNRIISIINDLLPTTKTYFTYNSNGSYSMDCFNSYLSTSTKYYHEDIFVNSNALVDSTYTIDDGGPSPDTISEKYFYNQYGLSTKNEYWITNTIPILGETVSYNINTNGLLLSSSGPQSGNETYDYYYNSINYFPAIEPVYLTNGPNAVPELFSGPTGLFYNKMKPLIKSINDGYGTIENYTYTFDSNNRISTLTYNWSYNTSVYTGIITTTGTDVYTYTYF